MGLHLVPRLRQVRFHIFLRMAAVSDPIVFPPNPLTLGTHDDFVDLNFPTQVETPRHTHRSELLIPKAVSELDGVGRESLDDPPHLSYDPSGS